jgi:hypothetical protein
LSRQSADDHDPATTTQEVSFPLDDDELLDWHGMQLAAKKHCSNTLQLLAIIDMISLLVSLAVALLLIWQTNKASGASSLAIMINILLQQELQSDCKETIWVTTLDITWP